MAVSGSPQGESTGPYPPSASTASAMFKQLGALYPGHPLEVNNDPQPFSVLIGTMLSARTQDPTTNAAMRRLWARADTPQKLLMLPEEELAALIRPVGFFRQKAKHIHGICTLLLEEFGGEVPRTRDELLRFPGVGRKVANLVLSVCWDIPAICVDTHVHRITNRFGWVATKTPEQTEAALEALVAKKHWAGLNRVLVNHGQQVCHPTSPKCSECAITKYCHRIGVERSR